MTARLRVLIIDGDDLATKALSATVRRCGPTPVVSPAKDALAVAQRFNPDLVLIASAQENIALANQLSEQHGPGLVIVALSDQSTAERDPLAIGSGASFTLVKPVGPSEMDAILQATKAAKQA